MARLGECCGSSLRSVDHWKIFVAKAKGHIFDNDLTSKKTLEHEVVHAILL